MFDAFTNGSVQVGVSRATDATAAVTEAAAGIDPSRCAFILVFGPQTLETAALADALKQVLGNHTVFGCTTAGQITPDGYEADALLLMGMPKSHFRCASLLIRGLQKINIAEVSESTRKTVENFPHTGNWNRLALLLTDGLSKQEDLLVAAIGTGLRDIPVFGGSAGDGLAFNETFVLHNGVWHSDAALLILLETNLSFVGVGFDHFVPTDRQMVVTRADPEERLVQEINGAGAAVEYARQIGHDPSDLGPRLFAENPVLVRNHNAYHVRAIRGTETNGALSFLCAIDDGLVLTIGRGKDVLETLETSLSITDPANRQPEFILGFDCILRRLEIEHKGLSDAVSSILCEKRVLGFNTYGEQHRGVHVNQTFVGIAFFQSDTGELA